MDAPATGCRDQTAGTFRPRRGPKWGVLDVGVYCDGQRTVAGNSCAIRIVGSECSRCLTMMRITGRVGDWVG